MKPRARARPDEAHARVTGAEPQPGLPHVALETAGPAPETRRGAALLRGGGRMHG
jgi:hypothetical protein